MANEEHLAILRQGVAAWNRWRREKPDVKPDLSQADLEGVPLAKVYLREANLEHTNLQGAYLEWADLRGANVREANLRGVDLERANLQGARLERANLKQIRGLGANLEEAHLEEANLEESNLKWANLRGANLERADLSNAYTGYTIFINQDLSQVKGLSSVIHDAPSTIGIDTLVLSQGKIPEVFLRGCGVPQSFIEYLPSLLGAMEPIQFYSCFISHSAKDEGFAKRLHSKMRDNNLRVWFANEDLKGGYKLHEQIDEAIRVYDKLIVVLSPESLRSKWVMNEVRRTRKAELANNQRKFFPIALMPYRELQDWECIDPETGTDLAAEIREYYVPDFRDWKNHDSFEKAFVQLLEGLKAVDAPPAPRIELDAPRDPLSEKRRRLKILEGQQASMGLHTPPHIIMEIEDLRHEIGRSEGCA